MRDVAALVNAGAHRVTPAVIALLRRLLGDARVHVTRSLADAHDAIAAIVADRCDVACIAGGDGTFIQAASDILALAPARPPILFALPFGLGNAISDISGATPDLARAVARARSDESPAPLHLVRANARITYYAGVGMDAIFVEDLHAIAKRRIGGAAGIAATALVRTLPRLIAYRPPSLRVVATAPAARLGGPELPAGTVLHDGPALMAAGGTIASYGMRFQAFPFAATAAPRFHLRVWTIGARAVLRHLPAIWRGTYAPPGGVHDWAASGVRITWSAPHPIHIGGDLCAPTTSLDLASAASLPILRR